jgi:hypothetical protein
MAIGTDAVVRRMEITCVRLQPRLNHGPLSVVRAPRRP